ncbi:hypothetical protein BH11BAC1_BH11BAC1_04690 [soil metagenome]
MKKFLKIAMLTMSTFINQFLVAQNLVPNPSFEDKIVCPQGSGNIYDVANWSTSNNASPDYFNSCSNPSTVGVPFNSAGYQLALHGNGYVGIGTYFTLYQYREIIGVQLLVPLTIGIKYYISAYFSLNDSATWADCATNNIGFMFSNIPFNGVNHVPIDNFSHIHYDSILTDRINWTRIGGSFIADSTYQYLMIGNFYDDAHTDTSDCAALTDHLAYYYVDAVCVSTDSIYDSNWIGIHEIITNHEVLDLFPNPVNNMINLNNFSEENSFSIINITGEEILSGELFSGQNQIAISSISDGIYFLLLNKHSYKILIIHK